MYKVYQSTFRLLAAQILSAQLLAAPADSTGMQGLRLTVEGNETFEVPTSWATKVGLQVGGYLGFTGANGQGQAHFIPAAEFPTAFALVGELPRPEEQVKGAEPEEAKNALPVSYTFDAFVEYGINAGGNVVDGYPWSFQFHGRAVTHETNDRYRIMTKAGKDFVFNRGEVITVDEDGMLSIAPSAQLAAEEIPVEDRAAAAQGGA